MKKINKRLGEILIEKNLVTDEQLQAALTEQYLSKEFLGTILVKRGLVTEANLLKTLAEQFGIPYLSIKNRYLDLNLSKKFSASFITDRKCFPIEEDSGSVTLAIIDPLDVITISEAQKLVSPRKLKVVLTSFDDMSAVIDKYRKYMKSSIVGLIEKISE